MGLCKRVECKRNAHTETCFSEFMALTTLTAIRHRPSSAHAKTIWVDRCGLRALGMIGLRMTLVHAHTPPGQAAVCTPSYASRTKGTRSVAVDTRITPNKELRETRLSSRNLELNTAKQSWAVSKAHVQTFQVAGRRGADCKILLHPTLGTAHCPQWLKGTCTNEGGC